MRKRILSLLLCIVMCLSLLPTVAFAYSAGDIPGTTGTGTESDPVICDTYAELKAALQSSEDLYITVNSFNPEGAATYKMLSCGTDYPNGNFAISVPSGTEKHLTINTLVDLRAVSINDDEKLYSLISNDGTLYVSGTGKLNGGFNAYYMNAVIINQPGATLDISGDISITTNSNVSAHGRAIYNKGKMAIHSGTFVGDNGTKLSDNLCQAVLNESAYASSISGGTFWCNRAFSTQERYGLSINDEGGSLTISAGIFREGIKVGTGHTVDEYIAEGSKYETSGDGTVTVSVVHTHSYTAVVTDPTCTEKGYTTHTCACGDSYVDTYITATGHTYGEWAITKEPTETETGSKERTCACGDKQTEELPVLTPATYSIISGANGEWTKGSSDGLAFTSDADFAKFVCVMVDGAEIAATNYTAVSGSTKVTLNAAYLETLSVGSHSIVVASTDGTASTNFTVKSAAVPPVPTTYTVTFDMNGHGDQVAEQKVKEGEKATKPADPTASGYTFDGWYADATFSAAFDFDTAINADTTIYAKWTKETSDPGATDPQPATYTVTFNMNGHGTQVPAQTVEEGNKAAKPADPTESGYTFDGWYADATFSAKFDFSSAINANTTVYAKWTEVKKDEPTKPADPTNPTNPTQPTKPADLTSPKTGDNSHLFLWVALLLISGGALAGTAVYGKKRKYNAK